MIKCQIRQCVHGEPSDIGRIRARLGMQSIGTDQRVISNRDQAAARIAVRSAERVELLELDTGDLRFLFELAMGTEIEILILFDQAAGQRPLTLVRRILAVWIKRISRRSSRIVKMTMSVVMVSLGMRNFDICAPSHLPTAGGVPLAAAAASVIAELFPRDNLDAQALDFGGPSPGSVKIRRSPSRLTALPVIAQSSSSANPQ